MRPLTILAAIAVGLHALAANDLKPRFEPTVSAEEFHNYWFDGTGEITTYELSQSRYGEIHKGSATLIYVTENFLPEKQVKDESGHEHAVPVLKLNFAKNFQTGVYPYSMMFSSFTQLDGTARLLKLSETSQDWCGHSFSQINWRDDQYDYRRYSYFEAEGDTRASFPSVWQEDQLWTLARLNPQQLPTGKFKIWQGAFFTRLIHIPAKVGYAHATLKASKGKLSYRIEFPSTERTLEIEIEKSFPHEILGWKETYTGIAWNSAPTRLTTEAKRVKTQKLDYWNRHRNSDR